jgi:ABC-2 type transport system ATP-binding protein
VLGLNPTRDRYALQERIGVQLQAAQLQKRIKVGEAVGCGHPLPTPVDGDRLIEQLGLTEQARRLVHDAVRRPEAAPVHRHGAHQRPRVVFLDELTTGLDPQARRAIWDLVRGIRQRGKTVFLTTHLMEEAERLCDRVAIIDHGRIIDIGTPAELVRRHSPQRRVMLVTDDPSAPDRFRSIPQVQSV